MSNKRIISLVAVLFIVIIGLTGGLFMIWTKLSTPAAQANSAVGSEGQDQQTQQSLGPIYSLDTFIVNLADEGGKRYLRVTMDLELANGTIADDINKRLPQMRDSILMVLPTKRFDDIRTVDGKISMRNEIMANLNGLFGKESISNIFFTEFVVQ
jgi:flagellar FliL protein